MQGPRDVCMRSCLAGSDAAAYDENSSTGPNVRNLCRRGDRVKLHRIALLLVALTWISMEVQAQTADQPTIGILSATGSGQQQRRIEGALAEQGLVDGRTATLVRGFAEGRRELLTAMADDMVRARADVILTMSTSASLRRQMR